MPTVAKKSASKRARTTKSKTGSAAAANPAIDDSTEVTVEQIVESASARDLPARRPGWMNAEELSQAAAAAAVDVTDYDNMTARELRIATKKRLKVEIDFIGNVNFADAGRGDQIFAAALDLSPAEASLGIAAIRKSGVDLPVHLSRLCEAPLLKPEQERMLFQRMNFLMQTAAMHRAVLNPERPSRRRLQMIDELLAMAEWHRDRIVEANVRLVFSIVKKFVNPNNNFDELLSDGIVALMRAVEKFDFDRGFRFSTYATQVVRRNSYRTVVLNQQDRQKVACGLQEMDIDMADDERTSAISEKRWHELRSRLSVMLNDLDRREKFIIRARFSLGSHRKVHTLQALADRLGVSKERVRQLERRAMDKLKVMAGGVTLAELEG